MRRPPRRPLPMANGPPPKNRSCGGRPPPDASFSRLRTAGTLTPNALFYQVHYGGIPAIDPAEHRLLVHGLVERPTLFTSTT